MKSTMKDKKAMLGSRGILSLEAQGGLSKNVVSTVSDKEPAQGG